MAAWSLALGGPSSPRFLIGLIALVLVVAAPSVSEAKTVFFNTTRLEDCLGGCHWEASRLWEGGAVPAVNDDVIIDLRTVQSYNYAYTMYCNTMLTLSSFRLLKAPEVNKDKGFQFVVYFQSNANIPSLEVSGANTQFTFQATLQVDSASLTDGAMLVPAYGSNLIANKTQIHYGTVNIASSAAGVTIKHLNASNSSFRMISSNQVKIDKLEATSCKFVISNNLITTHATILSSSITTPSPTFWSTNTLTVINSDVNLVGRLSATDSVNFINTTGSNRLVYSNEADNFFSGGRMVLTLNADSRMGRIVMTNNATVVFSSDPNYRTLTADIEVYDNSTMVIPTSCWISLSGSLTFVDANASVQFFTYYYDDNSYFRVKNKLTLNNNHLIISGNPPRDEVNIFSLNGPAVGQFNSKVLFVDFQNNHIGSKEAILTNFRYVNYGIYFTYMREFWPAISWGVVPIIIAISIVVTALVYLAARKCGQSVGDLVDHAPAGHPYLPVRPNAEPSSSSTFLN